jgi:uncharacterized protein YjbI with pentapeptide repeats
LANEQHINILSQGVDAWNRWRETNPNIQPDLRRANLANRDLAGANLSNANLDYAQLTSVNLIGANLNGADLQWANMRPTPLKRGESNLVPTNLTGATLVQARLIGATLVWTQFVRADLSSAQLWDTNAFAADFSDATLIGAEIAEARLHHTRFLRADLTDAYLSESSLIKTDFEGATLVGCNVYGISAWDLNLKGATQAGLIFTPPSVDNPQPTITVDDLEVAQFIYLLINNQNIRRVIDTITSKVVLLLGRFTHERKTVLDALREQLRQRNYVPVLFDFERPSSRDLTETVSTIAHMARFVIVDITDPRSVPQELSHIVPNLPSVPVQSLLDASTREYGMFEHFKRYPWVMEPFHYENLEHLLDNLAQQVIAPAEAKAEELGNGQ